MASLTYDGRTFMIDGRRFMLVGGEIDHALIPPDEWPDRLHAARLAGLTTISTRVFWSLCEPRPGAFDFSGRADVRRFIQLAGEAGLNVILRPGPFVGGGWRDRRPARCGRRPRPSSRLQAATSRRSPISFATFRSPRRARAGPSF